MRILHILNHTRKLNGHVHAALDLACAQADQGNRVTVASAGGDFDEMLHRKGVSILLINQDRRPKNLLIAVLKLAKISRDFDIIHAHMVTSALVSWLGCMLSRTPLITTVHNEFQRSSVLMAVGSRVIAVSSSVCRAMERKGISKKRLRTVLNGTIGSARFDHPPVNVLDLPPGSILFVGGLHPRKGVKDLILAFSKVSHKFPNSTLHIVGEGPHRFEYEAFASKQLCKRAIVFHGGSLDPRPWFRSADIFVLPSHSEPAGLVLSEASEAGCAIVASKTGGIPEMLDEGRAGILFEPGNINTLAEILEELLGEPARLDEAKLRSLSNRPRMTLARVSFETMQIYREVSRSSK